MVTDRDRRAHSIGRMITETLDTLEAERMIAERCDRDDTKRALSLLGKHPIHGAHVTPADRIALLLKRF
jgi:hypothetical protein